LNLEIDGSYVNVCVMYYSQVVHQVCLDTFSTKMMLIMSSGVWK